MFSLFLWLSAIVIAVKYGGRRKGILPDFGRLLECPEFVDNVSDWVGGRSVLKGQFRGRNVALLLEDGELESTLIISMETHAARTMDTYAFAGYKGDRESEVALFALEVKHGLMLRHLDGYLKAQGQPPSIGFVQGVFDPSKWQSVLESAPVEAVGAERAGRPADPPGQGAPRPPAPGHP